MPDSRVEVKGGLLLGALNIDFTKELAEVADQVVIPAQVRRIAERKNLEGGAQKHNAPATIERKGHDHPLVEKGLLARPKTYARKARPKEVRIFLRAVTAKRGKGRDTPRNRVAGYLEKKGYDKI